MALPATQPTDICEFIYSVLPPKGKTACEVGSLIMTIAACVAFIALAILGKCVLNLPTDSIVWFSIAGGSIGSTLLLLALVKICGKSKEEG